MEVKLFASLRENRGKTMHINWHDGIDGRTVMERLGIEPSAVSIYLINGKNSPVDTALAENDVVSLFPPVGGG
ncbi:MAG: MoaD/ThiS family protein [Defluviitaleaceae bacterium]|nr:MoaD/ThiS family protein [Defluviitaleaceae bacterium]